jgi:hypothetical protein
MFWGSAKKKNTKKPGTIDLRKKQSFFDTLRKRKTQSKPDEKAKCMNCNKEISNKPIFCTNFRTRTKPCKAGPFCSDKCWDEHLKRTNHY